MAPDSLHVRLVQHASALDPSENRAFLDTLEADCDLVVLPEASARDFGETGSDLSPYAETLDGPYATSLRDHGAPIVAGIFEVSDDERPYNTLVLAQPDGVTAYRKIHLFDSFGHKESEQVHPGPLEPVVVEVGGWQVGLMTCYDLRFPELARALVDKGAEVIVLPAAWVAGPRKVEQWQTLVRARAIENTVFVVAVGQPGPRYTGHSMVVAPNGDVLEEAGVEEAVLDARLERAVLAAAREQNPSLNNRRL